jgi:hypothetical protein
MEIHRSAVAQASYANPCARCLLPQRASTRELIGPHRRCAMGIDLPLVWAVIILFGIMMYVVMDGFDLGIRILFPLVRDKADRDVMMNTVAPVWMATKPGWCQPVPDCWRRFRSCMQ